MIFLSIFTAIIIILNTVHPNNTHDNFKNFSVSDSFSYAGPSASLIVLTILFLTRSAISTVVIP